VRSEGIYVNEKSTDIIWDRTSDQLSRSPTAQVVGAYSSLYACEGAGDKLTINYEIDIVKSFRWYLCLDGNVLFVCGK